MNILLDGFSKSYGPLNRMRKNEILIHFLISLFAVCMVELLKSIPLCLEVKVIMNVLYANLLLHSFAKFCETENRIRKKELFVCP